MGLDNEPVAVMTVEKGKWPTFRFTQSRVFGYGEYDLYLHPAAPAPDDAMDAARYRFIRDEWRADDVECWAWSTHPDTSEAKDAVVDAAMQESKA